MKKYLFCVISLMFAVTSGMNAQELSQNTEEEEYLSDDREIDNYDFLYTNNGEDFSYDMGLVDNLIEEAFSHLGARYRSGSKGPNAFDCSGFTSYVYKQLLNTNIGCSSRDQYKRNAPVKRDELQRGDLVFFTSPRSGKNVGHVGIVIDVDPLTDTFTFIHASTKEGVKVNKSTDGYYSRRYIGARRVKE